MILKIKYLLNVLLPILFLFKVALLLIRKSEIRLDLKVLTDKLTKLATF